MSQEHVDLGFDELAEKYPEVPRFILRKIDVNLRGIRATERVKELAKKENCLLEVNQDPKKSHYVDGMLLRDGTCLDTADFRWEVDGVSSKTVQTANHPYTLDVVDGQFWLSDKGKLVDQVFFAPIPDFYDKRTSLGTPMREVANALPSSCISILVFGYCHFWKDRLQCKYCGLVGDYLVGKRVPLTEENLQNIYETVTEALKEEGRWQIFRLTAGSDPRGDLPYDHETEEYLKVLGAIEKAFGSKDFNGRLVGSALHKSQWIKLKEAGVVAVEPHLEVWDKDLFENICPGKAKYCGREFWLQSGIDAVEVFGRGNVCNQVVGGAELAQPYGFKTIDQALESTLEGAEFMSQRGITTSFNILQIGKSSVFSKEGQKPASLEYYVRLTKGLREIRKKYRIPVSSNDYRRCGIHPDTAFSRIDCPEAVGGK